MKPNIAGLLGSASLSIIFLATPSPADAAGITSVTPGTVEMVMTAAQRKSAGIGFWPDSTMGAFRFGGTNYVFGANGYSQNTEALTSVDLNDLQRNFQRINTTSNIPKGGTNDFDRNYAGGGTVYYDSATGILIHLYHGEHWLTSSYFPFYGAMGIAYSRNLGQTWDKLGEVISPQTARTSTCQVDPGAGTLVPRPDGYFYAYYVDRATGCSTFEMAVARAKISDVIAAAQAGKPLTSGAGNLFKKYYNGSFSQPGVSDLANSAAGGGAYTPLFISQGNAAFPSVAWDSTFNQFVMAYAIAWSGIYVRYSSDGINWSTPTQVASGGTAPAGGNAMFYPTVFNTGGGDPQTLGSQFYVYFVNPFGDWNTSNLKRVKVTLGGSSVPIPTVTFTASPTSITSGGSSTLTWSSTNTTSCTASGGWNGAKATSGSQSTGALTTTTTYTLTCTGAAGSASASATVTVGATTFFTITSPTNGATVFGTVPITGNSGSQWVNVAAYDTSNGGVKVAPDVTPSGGTYTLTLNTTTMTSGSHVLAVKAFSVPAGQPGGTSQTINLTLNVSSNMP